MISPSSPVTPATTGRRYRVFMDAGLLSPFNRKRGLFFLLVPLPALALCLALGQGVLGLALMALGFWPFPFRASVERDGISVAWLHVSERIRWDEILAVELAEDRRRTVIGKRALALFVERRDKPPVTLRGRATALSDLAAAISLHSRL
jgi:hypothetical protein